MADDDSAWLGKGLEPRREVGRLADHGLLLRRALADQLANHDQPGRDADPRRERRGRAALEPADRLDQSEPSSHRPLGVVLVRLRPAEVGEHAVAHVLGDMAVPAVDHLGAAF